MIGRIPWRIVSVLAVAAAFLIPTAAMAAPPVVKTVPWVATNPLIAHDTYPGKAVTLKGTSDVQGANITYRWAFGDGTPDVTGTVSNRFVIEAAHTYAGGVGDIFAATLTVTNSTTAESGSATYLVQMRAKSLEVESNIAIDEGLWYLHKYFYRTGDYGRWDIAASSCGGGQVCQGYDSQQGGNVTAFFVNGHRVDGLASNPYTETVQRAMRRYFALLQVDTTSLKTYTKGTTCGANLTPDGPLNPDCTDCASLDPSKNGYRISPVNNTYEAGIMASALAASGTPSALAETGPANVVGRSYRAILQDMVDWFVQAQYNLGTNCGFGGWHYTSQQADTDNSTAQWGAIVLLGAEGFGKGQYDGQYDYVKDPGIQIPSVVRAANPYWLAYSFQQFGTGNMYGAFGYDAPGYYPWGPWATTPSGLVQLAFSGLGRGGADQKWEKTEKYVRDSFPVGSGQENNVKDYYYGLYAFVKAMLLHVDEDSGLKDPITLLGGDFDWYAAEASKGAPTDGVARTLINDQSSAHWFGHYKSGYANQGYFETSWAIQMLNRTITESGAPVAVAKAIPNPAMTSQVVTLDGSASFHQDPTKSIVKWEWDIGNDGTYELNGPVVSWTAPSSIGNVQVKLRVTDNFGVGTTAGTILTVEVSIPPLRPSAKAGTYNFCPSTKPWFLDGSKSVNGDEGQHQPGSYPGDTIYGSPTQFQWNLGTAFGDAVGIKPDVTSFFTATGTGSYLIQLKVTDTTATSFPDSGLGNLSGTDSGQVNVLAATDETCACSVLTARAAGKQVQLNWTAKASAAGYRVFRSEVAGGPYTQIAQVLSTQLLYINANLTVGKTYYWVVRPLAANLDEICQSNEVMAKIAGR